MALHTLHPLDLPLTPMRERPSYDQIMTCLALLDNSLVDGDATPSSSTASWQAEDTSSSSSSSLALQRNAAAVSRYLESIVMSDLSWLGDDAENDDERETVWNAASRCLAARCGRTAMGDMTRRWAFPGTSFSSDSSSSLSSKTGQPAFDLLLREPALVGDDLGHKTWGTSYAMARMLGQMATTVLAPFRLLDVDSDSDPEYEVPTLELGAGTGLLGLAAAALWPAARVVVSDLPAILPNLAANVDRNQDVVRLRGGRPVRAGVLQWGGQGPDEVDEDLFGNGDSHAFELVLAADPLYDDDHPELLASAVDQQLVVVTDKNNKKGAAVVMVPMRDRTTGGLAKMFVEAMAGRGLQVTDQGNVAGQDSDWGEGPMEFPCRWWIFQRETNRGRLDNRGQLE